MSETKTINELLRAPFTRKKVGDMEYLLDTEGRTVCTRIEGDAQHEALMLLLERAPDMLRTLEIVFNPFSEETGDYLEMRKDGDEMLCEIRAAFEKIGAENEMTKQKLAEVLEKHLLWLEGKEGVRANLDGANLVGANLVRANLVRANLVRANLDGANLYDANLDGANLVGANLDGANLVGANLVRANLVGANLYGANLDLANLYDANLIRANLVRANLYDANLVRANLDGANLYDANLYGANLYGANLDGANLVGATINWQSNQLISEILWRAAGTDADKRKIAGLIRISTDWCWDEFLRIDDPLSEWSKVELAKWLKEDDDESVKAKLSIKGESKQ